MKFCHRIARNQIKIKSSGDKAFWDKTKSLLQYKAALVELKRGKTPVNQFFDHQRTTAFAAELLPRCKTVTADIHKALAKIYSGFGA